MELPTTGTRIDTVQALFLLEVNRFSCGELQCSVFSIVPILVT